MKHIKLFEEFSAHSFRGSKKYPKREFEKITEPKEPFKRDLTKKERDFMYKYFADHSWSNVDADGYIVLGGGEEGPGKFYITEEDLANFMEEEKMENANESYEKNFLKIPKIPIEELEILTKTMTQEKEDNNIYHEGTTENGMEVIINDDGKSFELSAAGDFVNLLKVRRLYNEYK